MPEGPLGGPRPLAKTGTIKLLIEGKGVGGLREDRVSGLLSTTSKFPDYVYINIAPKLNRVVIGTGEEDLGEGELENMLNVATGNLESMGMEVQDRSITTRSR